MNCGRCGSTNTTTREAPAMGYGGGTNVLVQCHDCQRHSRAFRPKLKTPGGVRAIEGWIRDAVGVMDALALACEHTYTLAPGYQINAGEAVALRDDGTIAPASGFSATNAEPIMVDGVAVPAGKATIFHDRTKRFTLNCDACHAERPAGSPRFTINRVEYGLCSRCGDMDNDAIEKMIRRLRHLPPAEWEDDDPRTNEEAIRWPHLRWWLCSAPGRTIDFGAKRRPRNDPYSIALFENGQIKYGVEGDDQVTMLDFLEANAKRRAESSAQKPAPQRETDDELRERLFALPPQTAASRVAILAGSGHVLDDVARRMGTRRIGT